MKIKEPKYYYKLVFSAQWKKVEKVMKEGTVQEKRYIIEALSSASVQRDDCYNLLLEIMLRPEDKEITLAAVEGIGNSGRSAALSQLDHLLLQTQDQELLDAIQQARHKLKSREHC